MRRPFPHLGKMKRTIRALQAQGEQLERVEVRGDDLIIVVAKRDDAEVTSFHREKDDD